MSEPDPSLDPLSLDTFLPYRLFVLASRISSSLAAQYEARFGISRPQWRVMAVLAEAGELSAAEVAARTAMDKVAVSRAVRTLRESRLLAREMEDRDRRYSRLQLTPAGHALYAQIVPVALAHEARILEQLSEEERELLNSLLERLNKLDFS